MSLFWQNNCTAVASVMLFFNLLHVLRPFRFFGGLMVLFLYEFAMQPLPLADLNCSSNACWKCWCVVTWLCLTQSKACVERVLINLGDCRWRSIICWGEMCHDLWYFTLCSTVALPSAGTVIMLRQYKRVPYTVFQSRATLSVSNRSHWGKLRH